MKKYASLRIWRGRKLKLKQKRKLRPRRQRRLLQKRRKNGSKLKPQPRQSGSEPKPQRRNNESKLQLQPRHSGSNPRQPPTRWRSAMRPNPAMAPLSRWASEFQVSSNALIAGKNSTSRGRLTFTGDLFTTQLDTKKTREFFTEAL